MRDVSTIYENRHELQDAASGVTECLKELIQLHLARYLPSSAVSCTALPLVLHILDAKLSSPRPGTRNTDGQNSQSELKQHRLNVLIEAMKTYQPQYDGVDFVSETVRHIVNLAQLDGVQPNASEGGTPSNNNNNNNNDTTTTEPPENGNIDGQIQDWTDLLISHPSLYLRLALTMDLSISKARLPEEGDFPANLRGLLAGGRSAANPMRALLAANRQQQQQQRQQQQHIRPVPGSTSSVPPELQRPKPPSRQQEQPCSVVTPRTMSRWIETDRAVDYGMQSGAVDMDLDGVHGYNSESESGSQESYAESADDHHHHNHEHRGGRMRTGEGQQQQQQQQEDGESFFHPFAGEEMEVLEAHVLDGFTLHNESPPSSEGVMVENAIEIFGEALGADAVSDWFGQTGKGDNSGGAYGGGPEDVETARLLMDAIR